MKPLFKTIEYAYPTSISACKGGYGKTGCYMYYEVVDAMDIPRKNVRYFATKELATDYAQQQPFPFTWLYLKYHPCLAQAV